MMQLLPTPILGADLGALPAGAAALGEVTFGSDPELGPAATLAAGQQLVFPWRSSRLPPASPAAVTAPAGLTVCLWLKAAAPQAGAGVTVLDALRTVDAGGRQVSLGFALQLVLASGVTRLALRYGGAPLRGGRANLETVDLGPLPAPASWHHLAFAFGGRSLAAWLDGRPLPVSATGALAWFAGAGLDGPPAAAYPAPLRLGSARLAGSVSRLAAYGVDFDGAQVAIDVLRGHPGPPDFQLLDHQLQNVLLYAPRATAHGIALEVSEHSGRSLSFRQREGDFIRLRFRPGVLATPAKIAVGVDPATGRTPPWQATRPRAGQPSIELRPTADVVLAGGGRLRIPLTGVAVSPHGADVTRVHLEYQGLRTVTETGTRMRLIRLLAEKAAQVRAEIDAAAGSVDDILARVDRARADSQGTDLDDIDLVDVDTLSARAKLDIQAATFEEKEVDGLIDELRLLLPRLERPLQATVAGTDGLFDDGRSANGLRIVIRPRVDPVTGQQLAITAADLKAADPHLELVLPVAPAAGALVTAAEGDVASVTETEDNDWTAGKMTGGRVRIAPQQTGQPLRRLVLDVTGLVCDLAGGRGVVRLRYRNLEVPAPWPGGAAKVRISGELQLPIERTAMLHGAAPAGTTGFGGGLADGAVDLLRTPSLLLLADRTAGRPELGQARGGAVPGDHDRLLVHAEGDVALRPGGLGDGSAVTLKRRAGRVDVDVPGAVEAGQSTHVGTTFAVTGDGQAIGPASVTGPVTGVGGNLVPKGAIALWQGTTAPAGWAWCDGTRGTPDLRGRFVVGASSSGVSRLDRERTVRRLADTGGTETRTLGIEQLPRHSHGQLSEGTHSHDFYGRFVGDVVGKGDWYSFWQFIVRAKLPSVADYRNVATGDPRPTPFDAAARPDLLPSKSADKIEVEVPEAGNSVPLDNRPPYIALGYIMKIV